MKDGLVIADLTVGYGSDAVCREIGLHADRGRLTAIIGPNGSGKTTLLRAITGVLRPDSGQIRFDGTELTRLRAGQRARIMALVSQEARVDLPLTVGEVVLLGRSPYLGPWQSERPEDIEIGSRALARVGGQHLAGRLWQELSGGERQKASIARALAQTPELLLLDEPTSHLDITHQHDIMSAVADLARSDGLTVVAVLHDLNLAAAYADHVVILATGQVYAAGQPSDVISRQTLREVYGVNTMVQPHPVSGRPLVYALADPPPASGTRVHVVGGGGAASDLLDLLYYRGFRVSLGAVNIGDHDWVRSRQLGFETVDLPAFTAVAADSLNQTEQLMSSAAGILIAPVPFGTGNIDNLRAATAAARIGRSVAVWGVPGSERDWTGGQAAAEFKHLQELGAVQIETRQQLNEWLDRLEQA